MPFDAAALTPASAPLRASASSRLAEAALSLVRARFAGWAHHPSDAQWAAIRDLLDHMERAAEGSLPPAVYVSPIPAGTGKSVSVAAFAEALMADATHSRVGMLIACNRIEEVKGMAKDLQAHRNKLCVVVGSQNQDGQEARAMGDHAESDAAQVVVCTQAALKQTLRTSRDTWDNERAIAARHFDEAVRFHYRGAPRAVRCWDEAIAFRRPAVLGVYAANGLTEALARQSGEAAKALMDWARGLVEVERGPCAVPDFEALGVDLRRLEEAVADRDELAALARALSVISGGTGWVERDNRGGNVVTHFPELPESLMPVIVTDASAARGVHDGAYDLMAQRLPVVRLTEADKTYGNLTIRLVPVAASRATYRDDKTTRGRDLIDAGVRYIRGVPTDDEVLVVSYRNTMPMRGVTERRIRDAIDARLTEDEQRRLKHLTWGRHTATNEHKEVRHIILMGLNFLPGSAGYAAAAAVLDKPMRSADPSDQPHVTDVDAMRRGMLRDSTLQAILRGNARLSVKSDCGVCEVVILQSPQTGLRECDYRAMFPGAVIKTDHTLMPCQPLKGKLKELAEIVERWFNAGARELPYPSLFGELKMTSGNFSKLVKRPAWKPWIEARGLCQTRLQGGVSGLRRLQSS